MTHRPTTLAPSRAGLLAAAAAMLALVACTGDDDGNPNHGDNPSGDGTFSTDWPGATGGDGATRGESADAAAPAAGLAADSATGDFGNAGGAERAIAEADIIQVHGDRLYALSTMSGLNVVDISNPRELKLLGAYRETGEAEPFEMYLQDDVALVMFSGWGQYVLIEGEGDAEDGYAWVQTSQVVALDVSDPASISLLGTFEVPGQISDSRIVGDVLYVVGYQDGYCWGCEEGQPRTSVVSLDVADPRDIAKVDELDFDDGDDSWGWSRRSVTVTTERMYVAGPEYGNDGPDGSSIQVVDISDPGGDMRLGATVEAAGEISSRWQMDEHEGVLRVISQPPNWRLTDPPVIQTFTVTSSDEVTALGSANMRLPRPEQLQSVRFDGDRAYAITFERTDPLFTIDLSEPATPRQLGELEIPGFVYHMEPRGDRLIGLGFDQGNPEGAITVSLFDVSTLEAPEMIARVNFGGDWAYLPEDQNRIHKVFRVLDDAGLIMVPHSGNERWNDGEDACNGWYSDSGVQLVDFTLDSLTLRGKLETRGEARRAVLRDDFVLTVTDQEVASFDVADRAAPEAADTLAVARNVDRALPLDGDMVARLSYSWWSNEITLDFVASAEAADPSAGQGEIALQELLQDDDACNGYVWVYDAIADGSQVTLTYERETYATNEEKWGYYLGVVVIDASDPSAPSVITQQEWSGDQQYWWYGGHYAHGIPVSDRGVVAFDGGVAILEQGYVEERGSNGYEVYRVRVIDVSDPSDASTQVIDLPSRQGYFGLMRSGDTLVTSHYEPVAGSPGVTRFYLDRIDVSDPGAPELLSPVNVPGVVMHYDAAAGYAVTMDLLATEMPDSTWETCGEDYAITEFIDNDWNTPEGTCVGYQQVVRLVGIDDGVATLQASHEIAKKEALRRLSAGDDRLVGTIGSNAGYYYGRGLIADIACFDFCGGFYGYSVAEPEQLLVFSGMAAGKLDTGTIELEGADTWSGWWGAGNLVAAGDRALVTTDGELAIIDLSDPTQPSLERTEPLSGYVQHLAVDDDRVVLSLGQRGCRVVEM